MSKYLHWYTDRGRGEEAAIKTGAVRGFQLESIKQWPDARLPYSTEAEARTLWKHLLDTFGINAHQYC